jgi:hypothetical protein|uniref:AgrD family cyclic lactone autoinducer peptide n=1 Tax=Agathobacter rectalis TaxID=39491 RepID=UPI003FF0CDCB
MLLSKSGGKIMTNCIHKYLKEYGKKVIVGVATYYANVSCTLVLYQPKLDEAVKKLRRF